VTQATRNLFIRLCTG